MERDQQKNRHRLDEFNPGKPWLCYSNGLIMNGFAIIEL